MQSVSISTTWTSTKQLDSCLFVRYTDEVNSNSEPNQDIESLLESYENCVQLLELKTNANEESKDCKLFIKTSDEPKDDLMSKINSFSMLCSAKVIEIHGNESNEYLNTLFNELVEELDGLSMYRSDYQLNEPLKELTITFKNFNQLWIYGLVVNLSRFKTKPVIASKDVSSFASIFNMISMFSNTSKDNPSSDLIRKLSQLKTTEENSVKSVEQKVLTQSQSTSSVDSITVQRTTSCDNQFCECLCHKNCSSDQNSSDFRQYIDKRFSDLEKTIENKFNSLENKLFSTLNLFINK